LAKEFVAMKKALAVVLAMLLIGVCTGGALAQVPFIQVYFDADYNDTQSPCKNPGDSSTLYVAALNINDLISAIDWKIQFPPALLYTGEDVTEDPEGDPGDITIGNSQAGIAVAYNLPRNGFVTMRLSRVFVEWTSQCDCLQGPQPLRVVGYDDVYSPQPKAVRWPSGEQFDVVGMLSLICPGGVSTETTTWGGVKALYR
jgi:hypothetical protein